MATIEFDVDSPKITLGSSQGGGFGLEINKGTGTMIVRDGEELKGLVNAADYSANFVNESLVTKRYVDNKTVVVEDATFDNGGRC